jgi:hypothetical protein
LDIASPSSLEDAVRREGSFFGEVGGTAQNFTGWFGEIRRFPSLTLAMGTPVPPGWSQGKPYKTVLFAPQK